jgi:hypothetical protein
MVTLITHCCCVFMCTHYSRSSYLRVGSSREQAWVYYSTRPCPAMPSLHDRAHDRWLHRVHIFTRDETGLVCQGNRYGKEKAGGTARPVHDVQNHTCRVTLLRPARRAAVLGQPSRLRPHWGRGGRGSFLCSPEQLDTGQTHIRLIS